MQDQKLDELIKMRVEELNGVDFETSNTRALDGKLKYGETPVSAETIGAIKKFEADYRHRNPKASTRCVKRAIVRKFNLKIVK